jgi:hypothetical protein
MPARLLTKMGTRVVTILSVKGQQPAREKTTVGPYKTAALFLPVFASLGAGVLAALSGTTGPLAGLEGNQPFWDPTLSFYVVAAGVIPLLLIAFAVERRADDYFGPGWPFRALLLTFLMAGELCALVALSGVLRPFPAVPTVESMAVADSAFNDGAVASASMTNVLAAGTAGGLVGGFVMIAMLAIGGPTFLRRRQPGSESQEMEREAGTRSSTEAQQTEQLQEQLDSGAEPVRSRGTDSGSAPRPPEPDRRLPDPRASDGATEQANDSPSG